MSASCSRRSFSLALTLALAFSLAAVSWPRPQRAAGTRMPETTAGAASVPAEAPTATRAETEERARTAYGKLGVSFEENRGQADDRVRFLSRRGGATVFLTDDEAAFVLSTPQSRGRASDERPGPEALARRGRFKEERARPKLHAVWMKFEGANPLAEVSGERELPGRVNYLRGSDPSKWQTNVRTYGAVRYRGIYGGVDLVYYGNSRGEMEYDFVVAPGADARRISLQIEGAEAIEVDASGDLVIATPAGEMRQRKPTVYQEVNGARREVEGGYLVEAGGRVRFALGEYDKGAPLVIDPVLEYSTYLGGRLNDAGNGIAVDSAGNAYLTGYTRSPDFPTANAFQSARAGTADAFVTKINADGSALVYSTYLGGSSDDGGGGIAVDSAGQAYVGGTTFSTDFPVANALQGARGGSSDAFLTKLNADGSALVYSTYLGGSDDEAPNGLGIAVDSAGQAYVTGVTFSTDFPTKNPIQSTIKGGEDSFVTKLNADGSAFIYSTYVGGSGNYDESSSIAVDAQGNAYITGDTTSTDFPTVNAFQSELATPPDAYWIDVFVTKLNADGSAFVYSTYLGGGQSEQGYGIAVDSRGNAYVTGYTNSADFPTKNPIQGGLRNNPVTADAFITKLNAAGSALVYSTYLGGISWDQGKGIAVDSSGDAHVIGDTASKDFPTANAVQSTLKRGFDVFVAKLNAAGSALVYSTYLGGGADDYGYDIAADAVGNSYFTGVTNSRIFPTVKPLNSGGGNNSSDAFAAKISVLSIRGRVATQGAVGVPWATVRLTGTQTITKLTDANGYYFFTDLTPGGDYTVTPSKTNLSFVPESRSFTDLNASLADVNFTVPSLSVSNAAVTERNWFAVTATFTVTLQPASTQPVTVTYQTADGATNSATAGSDYAALPATTLTFAPGETTKTVTVKVRGDTLDEPSETFRLRLSAAVNALATDNIGVCTITDDD